MSDLIARFRYWLWGDEITPAKDHRTNLVDEFNKVADDLSDRVVILKKLTERLSGGSSE